MRKKGKNVLYKATRLGILTAFVFLQTSTSIPFFNSKKFNSFNNASQVSILTQETEGENSLPWSDSEDNAELETDTYSESYSDTHHLMYPVFISLINSKQINTDLFFSDHAELISPPPEI